MKRSMCIVMAVLVVLVAQAEIACADEIKLMSTPALETAIHELGPRFERSTGHKLSIIFAPSGAVVKRIQAGETADVVITTVQGCESLVKEGKASAGSVTIVARSGIGLAVKKGAAKPDISSAEALKTALLAAKSITYSRPDEGGASGIHFAKVLDRLGIADAMKAKTVFLAKSGPVAILVANGDVEIAVQQLPELISVAGIDIIGPLPGDLQLNNVMATALMTGSGSTAASKAFVDFLHTPEAIGVIRAKGMDPG